MEKGKTIETLILPEELIQHIQSFLLGKEAARTTILSKSWYAAWLTRPTIDFIETDFCHGLYPPQKKLDAFDEFAKETMQRYVDMSLKIHSFRLRDFTINHSYLIVDAMKMGATHLKLKLKSSFTALPKEVLGCKTLLGLEVHNCEIVGEYAIRCSKLRSLDLRYVLVRDERFKDIMKSCCDSLEELSLVVPDRICFTNELQFHKLKHLRLCGVAVDSMFFAEFSTRFPCLNYLTINANCCSRIHIASISLRTIYFDQSRSESPMPVFKVPNLRKFRHYYSDSGAPPHLSIKGASRKWEFHMYLVPNTFPNPSMLLGLKRSLTRYRASRISLSLTLPRRLHPIECSDHEAGVEAVPRPVVVEDLTIVDTPPTSLCHCLMRRLFGICRPKFVTFVLQPSYPWEKCNFPFDELCERVMHQVMSLDRDDSFGRFGLKKVESEKVYEGAFDHILVTKIRFELIWKD